jgi:hypothetical protein
MKTKKVTLTYSDGFSKEMFPEEMVLNWWRYSKEKEHGGRPIQVDFYGYVPDEYTLYIRCQALLHPLYNEGVHIHV